MHSSLTQLVQLGLRMSVRPECPKIFESLASNGPKLTSSSTNKLCSDVQFILIKDYLSGLFEIQSKDYFRRNYFSKSSANGFNWLWLFSVKFLLNVELFSSFQSKKFRCFQWDFSLFYWILTGWGGHDVSFEIFIFAEVLNLQKTEIILDFWWYNKYLDEIKNNCMISPYESYISYLKVTVYGLTGMFIVLVN